MNGLGAVRLLQGLGLHAGAEWMLRRRLRRAVDRDLDRLHYLLALSLDAQGRRREAAACYARAMDGALAPLLDAQHARADPAQGTQTLQRRAY
jgi:hypothetical protein